MARVKILTAESGEPLGDISTFPTADAVRRAAQLSQEDYQRLYRQSVEQPDPVWSKPALLRPLVRYGE